MIRLNSHPRIIEAIKSMGVHDKLEYYANFLGFVDFYEAGVPPLPFPTFGVTIMNLRLSMLWNREFLEDLDNQTLKWLLCHELFHLLFNHINRTKGYNQKVSNIAQDMIINELIRRHHGPATQYKFTEPTLSQEQAQRYIAQGWADPSDILPKVGQSMAVQLDPNYPGQLVFEPLYEWLMTENEKPNQGALSQPTKDIMKMANNGQNVDAHMEMDGDTDEIRERIVQQVSEKAKQMARGSVHGGLNEVLDLLLSPPKKDNLKLIKKAIGEAKGSIKYQTYRRMNRKIDGAKGNKKIGRGLTVIWDWSGSMYGSHENVASELYKDGYELDIVGSDTQVNKVYKVTSKRDLKKVPFNGGGGTELMPAIQYVSDPKNKLNHKPLVILTDGYTDHLDFTGWNKEVLILTVAQNCSVSGSDKVRQIKIEK